MMNTMYQEAGKANCATFCEGAMACMTAYLIHFCSETVRMNTMNLLSLITHVKFKSRRNKRFLRSLSKFN